MTIADCAPVEFTGPQARVSCTVSMSYTCKSGGCPLDRTDATVFHLKKQGDVWIIERVGAS